MEFTDYQSQYLAYELTKRYSPDSLEKLAGTLVDAQIDLNPHQIDAALFAFQTPFSKGVILADEVGLGKTIEAGLVISQKWAERKRRILIITPANLRQQWYQELADKFFLESMIIESKIFNNLLKKVETPPFEQKCIVICSFQFAKAKAEEIIGIPWDLVVIDEAHRLRNVYKPSNIIANTLKRTLCSYNKLLLTATPLQNSLLELFGLVSFLDEQAFGDLKSFREQYANLGNTIIFQHLKNRIKPFCHRTLRRQVKPYIRYTKRYPLLQHFVPEEREDRLYNLVSEYLRRDNLQALPSSQRTLMTLVLRKLLASSSFAIAGALDTMINRLKKKIENQSENQEKFEEEISNDYEGLVEQADEWNETDNGETLSPQDVQAINNEIIDLEKFRDLALSIEVNAKGKALLVALEKAFLQAESLGAKKKAIIFTESRKTQDYLLRILSESSFAGEIVLFNGSNNDERAREIYTLWLEKHKGTDRVTGSRTADTRSALVDYFREEGQIMIATEAGAEGINLQFCSLVVNYDLPWNPQRIEQRIGRCHRYGQKHDVVVVNFLNKKNAADQRVYELLSEKFLLFDGVFGSSDEVLGSIESGIDFEKRIVRIYQNCRTPKEINSAFNNLKAELAEEINDTMLNTRQKLLENFDDEVREKLRLRKEGSEECLNKYEQLLMQLTNYELRDHATIINDSSFQLNSNLTGCQVELGLYELPRRSGNAHLYRPSHILAQYILKSSRERELKPAVIIFKLSEHKGKVSAMEPYSGKSGILALNYYTIESLDMQEDHLIISGQTETGEIVPEELLRRMITLPAHVEQVLTGLVIPENIKEDIINKQNDIKQTISQRNATFFEAEAQKLECWSDDLKAGLERELKDIDRLIREVRRASTLAPTLEEKLEGLRQLKNLETQRSQKRRTLFDAQDEIDEKRDELIKEIEHKLIQKCTERLLYSIRWRIK